MKFVQRKTTELWAALCPDVVKNTESNRKLKFLKKSTLRFSD